jgi:hypothetical protein
VVEAEEATTNANWSQSIKQNDFHVK